VADISQEPKLPEFKETDRGEVLLFFNTPGNDLFAEKQNVNKCLFQSFGFMQK